MSIVTPQVIFFSKTTQPKDHTKLKKKFLGILLNVLFQKGGGFLKNRSTRVTLKKQRPVKIT
jgi:hypothetical protein